jgi:RNA-splicing ligase RtcB
MNAFKEITPKDLIAWGFKPGKHFPDAVVAANAALARGEDPRAAVAALEPKTIGLRPQGSLRYSVNLNPETEDDAQNLAGVTAHMDALMRVPTIVAGAVMPDACPSGSAPGTIPVGGVISAKEAIHPGMHSADICCSMAISTFGRCDPKRILDAGMQLSHFGGGGRAPDALVELPAELGAALDDHVLLKSNIGAARAHFATQGDGNHFFFVGTIKSTGETALVTHHGSRKPGALLYKAGMAIAEMFRQQLSPETPKHNAWIPSETREGEQYWSALQLIRAWTKANHFAIHDLVAQSLGLKVTDRFWNEHNFVFRKSDGLFYHAKGATPAFDGFAEDTNGLTLIPMNMAEPVMIARGCNAANGLGFSPHGAGRNLSRTAFMKRNAHLTKDELIAEQTRGIDARFFCGAPDVSELPGAYKNAAAMRRQIADFGLAEIVDEVLPYGSIMAGDWMQDAPWRKKKAAAAQAAEG